MASAWPWYRASEIHLVEVLSVQSSLGVYKLHLKISQLIHLQASEEYGAWRERGCERNKQ